MFPGYRRSTTTSERRSPCFGEWSTTPHCDSLAIGAPDEDITTSGVSHSNAGAVFVLAGNTTTGLAADGLIVQGRDGVPESPEDDDHFGAAISQGPPVAPPSPDDQCAGQPFDYSLVIAAPGEGLGLFDNGDGLLVQLTLRCTAQSGGGQLPWGVNCSPEGLGAPCRVISADDFNLPFDIDPYDQFGASLAFVGRDGIGGVPQLGWEFLAVGIPSANLSAGNASVGAVLEADPSWGANSQYWSQNTSGVAGSAEAGDRFGTALAVGDFDDDGRPDLAIGVPNEDDNSTNDSGAVQVLKNSSSGLTAVGDFLAVQGDLLAGETEAGDQFGAALAAGDFNGDGVADLAVGAPGENLSGTHVVVDAGAVNILYGVAGTGITLAGAQQFDADDVSFNGAFAGDAFGKALAAGDFDGNGVDDLVVGLPGPDDGSDTSFGLIAVFYGAAGGALGALGWADSTPTATEASATIQVAVNRTGSAVVPLNIGYSTANGTATAGTDYVATSGTISWTAGELGSKSIPIQILGDTIDESNETFTLHLTGGGGAVTRPADAVVTIVDNDTGGSLQFSFPVYTIEEGNSAAINVTRSGGAASGVTVQYASSNGTAVAGQDYTATSGLLSFGAGETAKAFFIPILDDTVPESAETVLLALSAPTGGATLGTFSSAVLVIVPNDGYLFSNGFEGGNTSAWSLTVP